MDSEFKIKMVKSLTMDQIDIEEKKKGKILVTGGTGYIGSHTAVELIQ